jgi:hypothetical protein
VSDGWLAPFRWGFDDGHHLNHIAEQQAIAQGLIGNCVANQSSIGKRVASALRPSLTCQLLANRHRADCAAKSRW